MLTVASAPASFFGGDCQALAELLHIPEQPRYLRFDPVWTGASVKRVRLPAVRLNVSLTLLIP